MPSSARLGLKRRGGVGLLSFQQLDEGVSDITCVFTLLRIQVLDEGVE